jgi:hypothetical protein
MKPNLAYLNIIFSITLSILLILSAIFLNSMADLVEAEEKGSAYLPGNWPNRSAKKQFE